MSNRPTGRLVAELLVIVSGVLIALGAEAWWSGREVREIEREYLELLAGEIDDLIEEVETALELENENLAATGNIGRLVTTGDPDEPFIVGYNTAGPSLRTGVLRQVDGVRGPVLNGDPALRAAVGDLLVSVEATQRLGRELFSDAVDNTRSALVEIARLQQPFGSQAGVTVAQVRTSPEILTSISFHIILLQNRIESMQRLLRQAEEVREDLLEVLDEAGIDYEVEEDEPAGSE